jgi:hypothetical protein
MALIQSKTRCQSEEFAMFLTSFSAVDVVATLKLPSVMRAACSPHMLDCNSHMPITQSNNISFVA